MVGYDPQAKKQLTPFDLTVAGVVSGVGTRALGQPLDVLKIRFQLQIERIHKTHVDRGKYSGMIQATKLIIREEGLRALWKGHIPAQGLSIVYGVVKFRTFEFLTKEVWLYLPSKLTTVYYPVTHFASGAVAASLATAASYPFDVVRTRLVGQGEPKIYKGMVHAATSMYKQEGAFSFYKGFIPTMIQVAPNAGFMFAFYSSFSHLWKRYMPSNAKSDMFQSLVCGGLAGLCAKTLTYPLDLFKKRLQIRGFENARRPFGKVRYYENFRHVFIAVVKEEGFISLFKGFMPSFWKAIFSSGLTFFFYEQTCIFLLKLHD